MIGATDLAVRPMTASDIAAVAALQHDLLEGSIVSALGPRFLSRFHAAALGHRSTRALVATGEHGAISGFVVGTLDVKQFNEHVKPRVLPALVRSLVTPRGIALGWRFARTLVEPEPRPHVPIDGRCAGRGNYDRPRVNEGAVARALPRRLSDERLKGLICAGVGHALQHCAHRLETTVAEQTEQLPSEGAAPDNMAKAFPRTARVTHASVRATPARFAAAAPYASVPKLSAQYGVTNSDHSQITEKCTI